MKILADFHHSDLFESYQLTLADRFGWEVFAPFGMEWYETGVWNFERAWHGDAVARQYLQGIWRGTEPDANGIVRVADNTHPGRMLVGITHEAALFGGWDYVLSSLPDNDVGLHDIAKRTGAAFGIQIGNVGQTSRWDLADYALVSTTLPYTPSVPFVTYHQEFSLKDFRYEAPPRHDPFSVRSFVQCLAENPLAFQEFHQYAKEAPDLGWGIHGSYGGVAEDGLACGNLPSTPAVAAAMRTTDVIWHTKEWSDGYGHVIHNGFAVGRPVFGIEAYYADKLAGPLWVDGVTSIDIGKRDSSEVIGLLRDLREDESLHVRMSEASAARFREVVSFDEDARAVVDLLHRVREGVKA